MYSYLCNHDSTGPVLKTLFSNKALQVQLKGDFPNLIEIQCNVMLKVPNNALGDCFLQLALLWIYVKKKTLFVS